MTYIPTKIITVVKDRLVESIDLTKPLSTFINSNSYLVVNQNKVDYCLSLGSIINFTSKLDLTKTVGQVITPLLTDLFVTRFLASHIPILNNQGFYNKRLKVFNPNSQKDHQVHFTSINTPTILDDATKKGFMDDLVIISDHDMTHYLVAVNGVFHKTTYTDGKLYVLDGFRTIRVSGRNDVTIIDTKGIGGHKIVPLTKTNVSSGDYQKRAVVTTPTSIHGKTVMVVIDGYFYHRDQKVLDVIDQTHLAISTNKLPLINQFRHNPRTLQQPDLYGDDVKQISRKYKDDYDTLFLNQSGVSSSVLATKEFQYSRLTGYHSFLVVFNNPALFTVAIPIVPSSTPQFYSDYSKRPLSGMMSYGCGLCPSYVIWRDVLDRKSIFLAEQDYDADFHTQSIAPAYIPSLIKDTDSIQHVPAQFVDYVVA